jgi:hypothetical protein
MHRTSSPILFAALALLVVIAAACAAGCASSSTGGKATTPSSTAAVGTTAGSSGTASGVAAVGYARLVPFVPKAAGAWKLEGDPMGMTGKDASGQAFSWVTGTYHRDGDETAQASVQIHDLATAESPLKSLWKTFSAYESTEGYMKTTTVKGFPAWDVYDKNTGSYSMMLDVGDRYLVYVTVEDGSRADLEALMNAMDLAGLAALK